MASVPPPPLGLRAGRVPGPSPQEQEHGGVSEVDRGAALRVAQGSARGSVPEGWERRESVTLDSARLPAVGLDGASEWQTLLCSLWLVVCTCPHACIFHVGANEFTISKNQDVSHKNLISDFSLKTWCRPLGLRPRLATPRGA